MYRIMTNVALTSEQINICINIIITRCSSLYFDDITECPTYVAKLNSSVYTSSDLWHIFFLYVYIYIDNILIYLFM